MVGGEAEAQRLGEGVMVEEVERLGEEEREGEWEGEVEGLAVTDRVTEGDMETEMLRVGETTAEREGVTAGCLERLGVRDAELHADLDLVVQVVTVILGLEDSEGEPEEVSEAEEVSVGVTEGDMLTEMLREAVAIELKD